MTAIWIHLAIHEEHPKVLEIASATDAHPHRVLSAAINWFRWVDANARKPETPVTIERFQGLCRWEGGRELFDAFLAIGWVTLSDAGTLVIEDMEAHFGKSAKTRWDQRARVRRGRDVGAKHADTEREETFAECAENVRPSGAQKAHKKRTHSNSNIYKRNKQQQVLSNPDASESGESDDDTTATAAALCVLLCDMGFSEPDAHAIAQHPKCTLAQIAVATAKADQAEAAPGGLANRLGFIRSAIEGGYELAPEPKTPLPWPDPDPEDALV